MNDKAKTALSDILHEVTTDTAGLSRDELFTVLLRVEFLARTALSVLKEEDKA
jgi:hypothetical protein